MGIATFFAITSNQFLGGSGFHCFKPPALLLPDLVTDDLRDIGLYDLHGAAQLLVHNGP